jgi:membrane protein DedA with SNARE-associated domain/rhodanese-related sulfurtransferase
MDSWITEIAQHGYTILFTGVFLEAIGLPVPAALMLLIAGGAAANGTLRLTYALSGAVVATLVGDTLMFLLGRYTGWWLLGLLCRISLNPESCVLRAADSFYRHGRMLLVIAKFIPGINTMAPPLAGSMNMRFWPFIQLDLAGAAFYVGTFFGIGFLFSGALAELTRGYHAFGRAVGWSLAALVLGYLGFQIWLWAKTRRLAAVPLVLPVEAAREVASGAWIYDVRSHGYLDAKAIRIQGSRRLDPNALNQSKAEIPTDRAVYVYCTCLREATSARVARELQKRGVRVAVIKGGLRAWRRAGLPVEPVPPGEMADLPAFA